jgi:hypothetical protein
MCHDIFIVHNPVIIRRIGRAENQCVPNTRATKRVEGPLSPHGITVRPESERGEGCTETVPGEEGCLIPENS